MYAPQRAGRAVLLHLRGGDGGDPPQTLAAEAHVLVSYGVVGELGMRELAARLPAAVEHRRVRCHAGAAAPVEEGAVPVGSVGA